MAEQLDCWYGAKYILFKSDAFLEYTLEIVGFTDIFIATPTIGWDIFKSICPVLTPLILK